MRAANAALLTVLLTGIGTALSIAQAPKVWTPDELFRRNIGTREDQDTAFPPHKIIGNLYYVGTRSLASFYHDTPGPHPDQQRLRTQRLQVRDSIEKLGFEFSTSKFSSAATRTRITWKATRSSNS